MDKLAKLIENCSNFELISLADKVYGPYFTHDDRQIVIIKDDSGKSRTVSYPKYILEQHLGRQLDPSTETVDHWDSDKSNNDISNLRIVPRAEHSADDTRRVKLVKLKCSECDKEFERSPRLIRDKAKKKTRGAFCGRSCAAKYNRKKQLGLADELDLQQHVDSEYYKRKYVVAMIDNYFQLCNIDIF